MAFFRRSGEKYLVAIAMTGIKMGDRLLHIGCTDPSLFAAIASKAGLSGRVSAVVASDADAARARRGAERGGILLELEICRDIGPFPFENESFDLVVLDNQEGLLSNMRPEQRVAWLQQAHRVLAPRGRIILIEREPRAGLGALFRSGAPIDPHYRTSGGAITALKAEGFKAVRQLAERDGLSFFEGVR